MSVSKISTRSLKVSLIIAMGSFADGFALLLQSGALIYLVPYFNLSSGMTGIIVSAPFLGSVAGALIFGKLADVMGRKSIVLNVLIFFILASILSAISINPEMLLIGRFMVGMGIGGDVPAGGALIAEISDPKERGSLLPTQTIMWAVGAAVATVTALPALGLGYQSWRLLFLLAAVPPVITLILRRKLYESFKWKAARVVPKSVSLNRRLFLFVVFLSASLFAWTMILGVFASYVPIFIKTFYGVQARYAILAGSVQWAMYMTGCLIAFRTADTIGRKRLIIYGTLAATVASAIMFFIKAGFFSFMLGVMGIWLAGGTTYTAVSIYSFEIPPTLIRGLVSGAIFASGRFGGFIGTLLFPLVEGLAGIEETYGGLMLIMIALLILTTGINVSTENIKLEDLETVFSGK